MEAIYDTEYNIEQALPTKPDYVHSMKLGIIDANIMTRTSGKSTGSQSSGTIFCHIRTKNNLMLDFQELHCTSFSNTIFLA